MFLTEYDQEKVLEKEKQEARSERNMEVASDMLKDGDSISKISRISKLSESTVRKLAKQLGITTL